MSSSLVKAHGGSKNLLSSSGAIVNTGIFVTNTMVGVQKPVHEKNLGYLIANTMGGQGTPMMDGVLTDTKQGVRSMNVPEIHKVSGKGKTQPKRMGQVPFAGAKY